jgi:hypothetical protein
MGIIQSTPALDLVDLLAHSHTLCSSAENHLQSQQSYLFPVLIFPVDLLHLQPLRLCLELLSIDNLGFLRFARHLPCYRLTEWSKGAIGRLES